MAGGVSVAIVVDRDNRGILFGLRRELFASCGSFSTCCGSSFSASKSIKERFDLELLLLLLVSSAGVVARKEKND